MVGYGCKITHTKFLLILTVFVYIYTVSTAVTHTLSPGSPGSRNRITDGGILANFLTLLPNK